MDQTDEPLSKHPKQIIVIRRELKMRAGQQIAMGAHCSMMFITKELRYDTEGYGEINCIGSYTLEQWDWIKNSFKKIGVYTNSIEEFHAIRDKAISAGLTVNVMIDNGESHFGGIDTETALAIGPHYSEKFEGITDHLPLL